MKTQTGLRNLAGIAALCAMLATLSMGGTACRAAEQQKAFESPDAAFKALLEGFNKNSDEDILNVLGHEHKDLVVQADKEESADIRRKIYNCAHEHLQIVTDNDNAIAHLGLKDWPFPIPMVKHADGWVFDTAAGAEEILNRRIGRNELHAIHLLDACHDAQRIYAAKDHIGNKVLKYAQKLISSKGKQDGLYWQPGTGPNEEVSPLAAAFEDGVEFRDGQDVPYFGYYFKVLTKQGENALNGKYDYVINGNMIAGFALVAWPADYRASGVMTFCISHQGVIYQKDLGPDTAKIAGAINEYNPDNTWTEVKPEEK